MLVPVKRTTNDPVNSDEIGGIAAEGYPSVSVVIPCRNAEGWIARCIQSVLDQSYPLLEVIVVDDGSTDDSCKIVKTFEDVILITTANGGAPRARNRGAARATSDYVLFLDADDEIEVGYLRSVCLAARLAQADLAIGPRRNVAANISEDIVPTALGREELIKGIFKGTYIQTGQMTFSRGFLGRIGGWREDLDCCQDIELSVRALLNTSAVVTMSPGPSCVYRLHDDPRRISARPREEILARHGEIFSQCAVGVMNMGNVGLMDCAAEYLYGLARGLLQLGRVHCGVECLAAARLLGLRGHRGSLWHVIVASLVGLKRKEQLRALLCVVLVRSGAIKSAQS